MFFFTKTKSLVINGVTYAKYEIEGDLIFLKVVKDIVLGNETASEDIIISIIELVEKKKITRSAYLNV